jgi:rubrerythrin
MAVPRFIDQQSDNVGATQPERASSRRRFIGAGLVLGGGGLVALGASPLASAVQNASGDDVELLNVALALEHLEAAFYREGLRTFDETAFTELGDDPSAREMLQAIRSHEQAHVEALAQAITDRGGSPVEAGNYDFGYVDLSGFLQVGTALENIAVGAYAELATAIADTDLLAAALGIHSVEARHAAYLGGLMADSPFPNAFDAPRSREEVQSLIGGLTVANARAERRAATPEASPATPEADASPEVTAPLAAVGTPQAPSFEEPPIAGAPEPGNRQDREERQQGRFDVVIADAAVQLGVTPEEVTVVGRERVEWPDASLGCPVEGEVYAQVITPGFLVIVEGNETQLEYHTDREGNFVLCS